MTRLSNLEGVDYIGVSGQWRSAEEAQAGLERTKPRPADGGDPLAALLRSGVVKRMGALEEGEQRAVELRQEVAERALQRSDAKEESRDYRSRLFATAAQRKAALGNKTSNPG